jgi:NTE family protein
MATGQRTSKPAARTRRAVHPSTHTALVLQGGAALGAYEAGVLRALLEPPARPLDIVTGCSIGALMAAILVGARGDPVQALDALWRGLAVKRNPFVPSSLVGLPLVLPGAGSLYRINPAVLTLPAMATHLYDPKPIEQALAQWVDWRKLNRAQTEVIVTAVDVKTGQLAEFSNRQGLTARHIVASASLPPVFPPARVGRHAYWDGGLISSTPLRPALNAIEAHNQVHARRRWELIIVDLFAPITRPPQDMTDVFQRLFELAFFGKFQHDLKLFETMNAQLDLMLQIDRALPARSPIRRHPAYVKLARHRRIDALKVIRCSHPEDLGGPADFSPEVIEHRIKCGYDDTRRALAPPRKSARKSAR